MPLDFPSPAVDGQIYNSFQYDGSKGIWRNLGASVSLTNRLTALESASNRILQVVYGSTTTTVTSSTTTRADTGLTATITPTSASSKILVMMNQTGISMNRTHIENAVQIALLRNGSEIALPGNLMGYIGQATPSFFVGLNASATVIDTPATTSPVVYKTQFSNYTASGTIYVQNYNSRSTITLIELSS